MIVALFSLLAATPHYDQVPKPLNADIVSCRRSFDSLENYIAQVNGFVWRHDVDRGGYLTWAQAQDIRHEIRMTAMPYLERIRYIGWEGRAIECERLSKEGRQRVYETAQKFF